MKFASLLLVCAVALIAVGCSENEPRPDLTKKGEGAWWRETFDGHTYVVKGGAGYGYGSGITHDPDCPCQKPISSSRQ